MSGSTAIAPGTGFVAPMPRTPLAPGGTSSTGTGTATTGQLGLSGAQASALGGTTGTGGVTVTAGSGAATRPSLGERALAYMKEKFEAFCGGAASFAQGVKDGVGQVAAYVSARIDALNQPRQTAPTTATPPGPVPLARTGPLQVVPGDTTSHASRSACDIVYRQAFEAAKNVDASNVGSFLRNENTHSAELRMANQGATDVLLADIFNGRPDGPLAFFQQTYDRGMPDPNGSPLISGGNASQVAQNSARFMKDSLERMFGSDPTSARAAASNLSQATKDLMATGFKAIDDGFAAAHGPDLSPDRQALKDRCKANFCANVVLRCINPQMQMFAHGNGVENAGMKEMSRCIQTLANTGELPDAYDPSETGTAGARITPEIHTALSPHVASMTQSIRTMLDEAVRQGVAQGPTTGPGLQGTA